MNRPAFNLRNNCFCLMLLAVLNLSATSVLAQDDSPQTVTPPPPAEPNPLKTRSDLEAAYQKEFALLEAQLRDLQSRLSEFENSSSTTQQTKQNQIDRIEAEFLELQSRNDRINELLNSVEKQISAVEDNRSTLEATFQQAATTLESLDLRPTVQDSFLAASDGEKIDLLMRPTLQRLSGLGRLRQSSGSFFLKDGTEVEGTLIHVGNIATYGLSGERGGALAPAGDNRFKVWSASTPDSARQLAAGNAPDNVEIFLYESSQKAIEESAAKTVLGVINSGGTIAWIIVGLGLLAALLVILRTAFLRNASASTSKVKAKVGGLVKAGRLDEALQACKQLRGSTARVVASAVRNLERDREHIEDIVSEQILHESAHLNRFSAFIMVIAAVAPLLGLLGTVTGMISTFDIITEFGTGDPKLLSSGISIALVTTEVGLAVAIPALIFGNLLSGWSESIKDNMEMAALHVMNLYLDHTDPAVNHG